MAITMSFVCEYCGEPFAVRASLVKKNPARFCSHRCHGDFVRAGRSFEERFWEKVDKSGGDNACWLWTGATRDFGYGTIIRDGKAVSAHRASFEIANGPIPDEMWVLHDCPGGDNPRCVNPAHLWLGTHEDNMRDMAAKGRGRSGNVSGEAHGGAILTDEIVRRLRAEYAGRRIPATTLVAIYGTSPKTISAAIRGRSWKHL